MEHVIKWLEYFKIEMDQHSKFTLINQMMSDRLLNKCVDDAIRLFSKFSSKPVYYYSYAHKTNMPRRSYVTGIH